MPKLDPRLTGLLATALLAVALCPIGAASAPKPSSKAKLIKAGKALYVKNCQTCHAADGKGTTDAPKLAGIKASDARITKMIRNGKQGQMPAFRGKLKDADIKALIAYLRSLK
ncbi:MAG TPA: cytochrome c [Fimbriimonadaceae bacterium]|nr:cytochrome c [Fimbriimonadaceae bacterium]